ncbi:hypothetical protein C8F01DRAFT_1152605 [Mycena amicta]|nr:hypothetical protein C8F01DRAFT_1169762 [Mycena amicta]KAJ7056891.1 hypothetical protein C8F01DRAFT_1152605 [Mycena amicta]
MWRVLVLAGLLHTLTYYHRPPASGPYSHSTPDSRSSIACIQTSALSLRIKRSRWLISNAVFSVPGNLYDALFMAAPSALCDCKGHAYRQYEASLVSKRSAKSKDVQVVPTLLPSSATWIELVDTWDEGCTTGWARPVAGRVTLDVATPAAHQPVPYLGAVLQRRVATPIRLLLSSSLPLTLPASAISHWIRTSSRDLESEAGAAAGADRGMVIRAVLRQSSREGRNTHRRSE